MTAASSTSTGSPPCGSASRTNVPTRSRPGSLRPRDSSSPRIDSSTASRASAIAARCQLGELVAISEQGFSSKSGVVKGLDVVRRNAAAAEGHTEPEAASESTPDAAPKRARTKKDA